jgi:signal transduction histidine kinase/CheY-like chemotaxis protein
MSATPETRQLARFLAWNFWAAVAAALFLLGLALVNGWTLAWVMAGLVAVNASIVRSAQALALQGAHEAAAFRFAMSAWLVATVVGISVPLVFPVVVLVAFLPLALMIPYGTRRMQALSFAAAGGVAALLAAMTYLEPPFPLDYLPGELLHTVNVVFIPMLAALYVLSLWNGYLLLRDSNDALRDSNAALQESEASLERKVAERTGELELSRGELAAARDAAVAANAAKSRFLAAASHDLRQPIHALRLFAEALGSGDDPERMRELGLRIRDSSDSLIGMFDELLDLSRLESGSVEARFTDFPLGPLLDQLAAELAPEAAARGIALRVVRTSAVVRGDPLLLRRILQNLLVNALRYTERGRVLAGVRRRRGAVRVEVWDTGPGIPESRRGEIFREFTQLDQARRSEGLGLGLAIVDRLARLLDYRIEVDSVPGKGSVFRVIVPLSSRGVSARPALSAPAPGGGLAGRTVAVIDDDLNILEAMRVLLESWGCELALARSAEEAIDGLKRRGATPDVVLADYTLEAGATGIDAIAAIRSACGSQVAGVIITGETDASVLERVRAAGLVHLIKPIAPARLRAALGHALRERASEARSEA